MAHFALTGRTLIFERDGWLHSAAFGRDRPLEKPRRLGKLPTDPYGDGAAKWSVSLDGRHLAFLVQTTFDLPQGRTTNTRMVDTWGVHIADLPDLSHRRPLFHAVNSGLAGLPAGDQDAALRKVSASVPYVLRAADGSPITELSGEDTADLTSFSGFGSPVFASDHRTLIVSMKLNFSSPAFAACAVNLRTGRAITNREGQWRVLSASTASEEIGGVLVGTGIGRTTDEGEVCNACSVFGPIIIANTRTPGRDRSLLPTTFDSKHRPPFADAYTPSLAPDRRRIAFFAGRHNADDSMEGLWIVDRDTRHYHRLTHEHGIEQICWESPESLLVLKKRPQTGRSSSSDLYRVPLHANGRSTGRLVRILENADRFQLLPSIS